MNSILNKAKKISPEFAKYIEKIAEKDFNFTGPDPLMHSSYNHEHLLFLGNPEINIKFRKEVIEYIISRWKIRLKNYHPYKTKGFRIYLYEENAPTLSVVAETPKGFPYKSCINEAVFVDSIEEVLRAYNSTMSQRHRLFNNSSEEILKTIEKFHGSIGIPTAKSLGINVANLRKAIENRGLIEDVNRIRKKYKRSPAKFKEYGEEWFPQFKIYEERLKPGY